MTLAFFKKKSVLITLGLVVAIGGGLIYRSKANAGPFYDTQAVEQATLTQTVEVTGETKPQARVDLSFKTSGKLETLNVTVGQVVKTGDVLATLDAQEATFAMRRAGAGLAQAQASLAARQAQDTPQAIEIAVAQRDQAKASLAKAESDLDQLKQTSVEQVRLAQIALETATQNLTNSGAGADITVETSLASLRASLLASANTLSAALTEADAILGVENTAANDTFQSVLGIYDSRGFERTQGMYLAVRSAQRRADTVVRALTAQSSAGEITTAGQTMVDTLQQAQWLLEGVQSVLTNSGTSSGLTINDLTTKRASVQALRTSVSSQYTSISSAVQGLQSSTNAQTTARAQLENALKTAQANLTIAQANQRSQIKGAETTVEIQRAGLVSAEAALSQRKAPVRAVDLQVLRVQIQDAQIAYEQAVQRVKDTELVAPIAGTISDIVPARGEQVVQNAKVMGLVVTENYSVEASIPEADIAKIQVGQTADVTLDAFGDDVHFSARVLAIEPDRIKSQDAIFYKLALALDPTERAIKPGFTANVTITTGRAENALIIPIRAVRSEDGKRSVRVLKGKEAIDVDVTLGLRGDDGRVQIMSGLNAGDQVIVGELTAAEYAKNQADSKAAN